MRKFLFSLLAFIMVGFVAEVFAQEVPIQTRTLSEELDERDFPGHIPGETMGQKLESLLFWSGEEKIRRFPKMHLIYPSVKVEKAGNIKIMRSDSHAQKDIEQQIDVDSYLVQNQIGGLIVVQNDTIKLEKYGQDVDTSTLWTSFSVAKSISSMLVGIALKNGDIESMDDELQKYIPEFKNTDYGKVSVRQLLTMTSGMAWNEDYTDPNSDVAQMYQADCVGKEAHILTYMKKLTKEYEPGTQWNYSTGETDLVGILIQKASGKSLAEYLSEYVWKPFGMEFSGYWLADECSGLNIGGSGLSASLRDYARLGLIMLYGGQIEGVSIFANEWLANATSSLYATNEEGGGYGYLWWHNPDGAYIAQGIFGQMVYVHPSKKLVIAQVAAWPLAGSEELSKARSDFIQKVNAVL